MSETKAMTLAERARAIDEISSRAVSAFASAESFEKELAVAQAVGDLRLALTPEVMQPVMALMNTSLGFRTDRDPVTWNKPEPCVPYPAEVVRECFIESRLRGFHVVGNEFNIIAGRFYGCLNGFERKVRTHEKVTDFRDWFDVPRMSGEKGALVKCRAEWKQEGAAQVLEREFAVRVNAGMGADAIVGKAKRKLYAAVYARLSGVVTPEGDAGEVIEVGGTATRVEPTEAGKLFGKAEIPKAESRKEHPTSNIQHPTSKVQPQVQPQPVAKEETPKEEFMRIVTEYGVVFDDFRDFVRVKNLARDPDSWASFEDIPEKVFVWFKSNPKTMAELLKKFGKKQSP